MVKGRNARADLRYTLQLDVSKAEPRRAVHLQQNLAPGSGNEAVAVGFAPVLMAAGLRRRHHKQTSFNGSGTEQHLPVRLTGRHGERRRYRDGVRSSFRQRRKQRREAEVVTDREPQSPDRREAQKASATSGGRSA